jgi:hypothetical protein
MNRGNLKYIILIRKLKKRNPGGLTSKEKGGASNKSTVTSISGLN